MTMGPFVELTVLMHRQGLKRSTVAKELGMSQASLYRRMTGESPWTLQEMYGLSDLLGITTDDWGKMFPNIYRR